MKEFDKENTNGNGFSKEIWDAFGYYIRKNLLNGKMIKVPKLGNFTFTFPNHVNLAGATNPEVRD